MYKVESSGALVESHRRLLSRRRGRRVGRTVVLLGLVSLLTDISAEMVATVLPLYLVYTLGFTPLQFGLIDGLYQGAAALVRMGGGFVGDRFRRHKEVATVGYGLSAACKLAFVAVGSAFSAIAAVILLDRIGKGARTAPRDAMISLSTRREDLGSAFGVHRAMDTTGAMLGPLVAFGLLALAPFAFDSIFLVSFFIALIGLAVLVLFVENPRVRETGPGDGAEDREARDEPAPSLREAAGLLRTRALLGIVSVAGLLGLATVSDAFLYLALQDRLDLDATVFPLLFVGTAIVYMLLAAPAGRLADRVGRRLVFLTGYALLLAVYAALLLPPAGTLTLVAALGMLGAYYAATDGVLMALASSVVPAAVRGSGLALVGTATGLARFGASVAFGLLWTLAGLQAAVVVFTAALGTALLLAVLVLPGEPRGADA